jgi:tRNA A-37 threonylcarbamoyl transferase component Bud32
LAARFPQLEILELLGKGGMGAVYKARQKGLDRLVALKILPPEVSRDPAFVERFLREARALARLNHPNIVGVYDFGKNDGLCYFLMEYVDGVNLRQAIQAGSMPAKAALAVVPQICDALQFAHDEGIVHRDIKPENILIDKRGRVKIADFGLAKLLDPSHPEHLTGTQQVMGTLRYMAPEQLEGTREVDHRADIYSLGVVFYELLTGELPLGRFAPPSKKVQVDVRLDEIVLRALEKEPELRFQHASDVKTEVEAICGVHPQIAAKVFGREWRSKQEFLGLPLVHVAFGLDPKTGRNRVAKGIVAVGDMAVGVLAVGGIAAGGICFGGVGLGLVSISGLALGLWLAIGGCAIGLFANGGFALGAVAVGGGAVGYFAVGGGGAAVHGVFGHHQDPLAEKFFLGQLTWPTWLTAATAIIPPLYALLCAMAYLTQRAPSSSRRIVHGVNEPSYPGELTPRSAARSSRPFFVPVLATVNILFALLLLLVTAAEDAPLDGQAPALLWQVWALADNVLSFLLAAVIFLASIGLYLWQPWARKAIVGACVFGLLQLVVDMPYLSRFMIPSAYAGLKQAMAGDFPNPEELDAVASTLTLTLIGSTLLIYLAWMIVTLVYFTRPKVVAAFEGAEGG